VTEVPGTRSNRLDSDATPVSAPRASNPRARAVMRGNRRRDTHPERLIRSELHRKGLRYRVDLSLLFPEGRVRPDLAFTRQRVAVFVDGCYWHACPVHLKPSRSNVAYWSEKLAGNVARDRVNDAVLVANGWRVVRIWEHQSIEEAIEAVLTVLGERGRDGSTSAPGADDPR
jgi:DNA mismatch endonuclease (patch repair protein)